RRQPRAAIGPRLGARGLAQIIGRDPRERAADRHERGPCSRGLQEVAPAPRCCELGITVEVGAVAHRMASRKSTRPTAPWLRPTARADASDLDLELFQHRREVIRRDSRSLRALEQPLGVRLGLRLITARVLVAVDPRDELLDRAFAARSVLARTAAVRERL